MNFTDLLPMLAVGGVFVVVVLLPQLREKREHDALLSTLVKGDRVVTASGLHGTVASVHPDTVELEVSEGTRITVEKNTVARRNKPAQA